MALLSVFYGSFYLHGSFYICIFIGTGFFFCIYLFIGILICVALLSVWLFINGPFLSLCHFISMALLSEDIFLFALPGALDDELVYMMIVPLFFFRFSLIPRHGTLVDFTILGVNDYFLGKC